MAWLRRDLPDRSPAQQLVIAAVAGAVGGVPREPDLAAVDWAEFSSLLTYHQVVPLVRRSRWLAGLELPAEVVDRLQVAGRRSAGVGLRTLALLADLTEALGAAGLDYLVLKGLPVSAWAYGDPLARQVGDIDLLVRPEDVPVAGRVLHGLGFEALSLPFTMGADPQLERAGSLPAWQELTFSGPRGFVDVHWRLFPNRALLPIDPFNARVRRNVDVGGIDVPTLSEETAWWYAAVHATKHRWQRLKWLADLPVMAAARPELLTPEARDRATAAGVDRCVATGLILSRDVLAVPLAPDLARWVESVPGTAALVRHGQACLAGADRDAVNVAPGELVRWVSCALNMRGDAAYRREEARLALVRAGRAYDEIDPSVVRLAAGPVGWVGRSAQRLPERARAWWIDGTTPGDEPTRPALERPPGAARSQPATDAGPGPSLSAGAVNALDVVARTAASAASGLERLRSEPPWRRRLLTEAAAELCRSSVLLALVPRERTLALLDPAVTAWAALRGAAVAEIGAPAPGGPAISPGEATDGLSSNGAPPERPAVVGGTRGAEVQVSVAGGEIVGRAADPGRTRLAGEIGRAVSGVARLLPWKPTCLRQAVAAQRMLRRRAIPAAVHLGVTDARPEGAHAWVEAAGRVVVGEGARP